MIGTLCQFHEYAEECLRELGDDPREELEIAFIIRRHKKKKKIYRISLGDNDQREELHEKIKELLKFEVAHYERRIEKEFDNHRKYDRKEKK